MTQHRITTMQDILDALDRNPELQREFHKHLADVVRKDEDLRQDLRKEILTEELLQLPARFTRLEEDVSELKQDMIQVKQQIANLEEGQVRMSGQIANLEEGQARMSGQIANLSGHSYEARAIEQSRRRIRRHFGMESATLLHDSKQSSTSFEKDLIIPAIRQRRINRSQADELEEADCIIQCENENGDAVCAVVEISLTVQDTDRARAAERAEMFQLATGIRTVPFVVGQNEVDPGPDTPEVTFIQYQG